MRPLDLLQTQESPFPVGDHKASAKRQDSITTKFTCSFFTFRCSCFPINNSDSRLCEDGVKFLRCRPQMCEWNNQ